MKTILVGSSNGHLTFDPATGKVLTCEMDEGGEGLDDIISFDIREYKKHYGVTEMPESIDILDLGYYYRKCVQNTDELLELEMGYEEPAHEWRIITQQLREGADIDDLLDGRPSNIPPIEEGVVCMPVGKAAYKLKVTQYLKAAYSLDLNDTGLEEWINDGFGQQTPEELVDQYAEKYDLTKII